MEQKKVMCLHPLVSDVSSMVEYLYIKDENVIRALVWEEQYPDYVIVTEHIYRNKKYFDLFKKYYESNQAVFIFHAGEAVSPDLNIFDYAVVQDRQLENGDRIRRIPPECFWDKQLVQKENMLSLEEAKRILEKNEKGFCNFIYANPHAHPMRDKLFYAISEYKRVDSLGAHLNNTGVKSTRRNGDWLALSVEMKSAYKFSIACENEVYEGYVTEKLLTSFQAHTVPIYWGDPNIFKDYNPDAFINCNEFSSLEEIVERVKEIDENEDLWLDMVTAPWKTDEQIERFEKERQAYQQFWTNIFLVDKKDVFRRPMGTFSNLYYKWFLRNFNPPRLTIKDLFYIVKRKISLRLKRNAYRRN